MAYAVEAGLNLSAERLIELTESSSAVGVKDSTLIALLLTKTEREINRALEGRYAVPFTDVPEAITTIAEDLWRLRIYEHREVMDVPKSVQAEADLSREILKQYKEGTLMLDAPRVSAATGPSTTDGSFNSDPDASEPGDRVFGRYRDGL